MDEDAIVLAAWRAIVDDAAHDVGPSCAGPARDGDLDTGLRPREDDLASPVPAD